ncbi:MAG TPA: hypothetical protein DCE78_12825, partial [Bacteroidetes bacterium]|nr:hypothetical protein [Bacteroidota bacterium]
PLVHFITGISKVSSWRRILYHISTTFNTHQANMTTNTLSLEQDIQPLSEFRRNSAQFISKLKKENRTIVLTQHGKSAAVLVDVVAYQRMLDKMELMEELLEAERQINTGDVVSHEEAKRQIMHNLEKWK